MPSPFPTSRQLLRSAAVPFARRGYQVSGTPIILPSASSTESVSAEMWTDWAAAGHRSIGEVVIPAPEERGLVLAHHQNDTRQFAVSKAAAVVEPDRGEPDFGAIRVALHVNVRWLGPVARIEEAAIWLNTKNGRQEATSARNPLERSSDSLTVPPDGSIAVPFSDAGKHKHPRPPPEPRFPDDTLLLQACTPQRRARCSADGEAPIHVAISRGRVHTRRAPTTRSSKAPRAGCDRRRGTTRCPGRWQPCRTG